ncbi:SDR family NAD(P)-dependent oxidoreductase [Actinomadura rugatobispora]|uniref:SDR family NAD(P)-dependent oxidoreductase n=1 Tax=Actinomadura rugatobispora TaxID=1994 RepID=A0ABW0ZVP5_9ACTN|nr:SDR family oxidoreductase [Actinomadura rugatobispora]
MSTGSFEGKAVLVTGGGSGIGQAAARQFAAAGADVLVADVDDAGARSTVESIRSAGGSADHQCADVSDEAQVEALVARAVDRFGGLDCAFNNAGVSAPRTPLAEMSVSEWDRLIRVNLTSVFLCMRAELRHMTAHGGGAIVNTASTAGLRPPPGVGAYAASKHGVVGLTKTAAGEHAGGPVRVNAICPGGTDTPLLRASIGRDADVGARWASRPMSTADDVAAAALWLCSDAARSVSGVALVVDRGAMFA